MNPLIALAVAQMVGNAGSGFFGARDAAKYGRKAEQAQGSANLINALSAGRFNAQPQIAPFQPGKTATLLGGLGQAAGMGMNVMSLANMLKSQGLQQTGQGLQNQIMQQQVDQGAMANEMSKLGAEGVYRGSKLASMPEPTATSDSGKSWLSSLGKMAQTGQDWRNAEVPMAGEENLGGGYFRSIPAPSTTLGNVAEEMGGLTPEPASAILEGQRQGRVNLLDEQQKMATLGNASIPGQNYQLARDRFDWERERAAAQDAAAAQPSPEAVPKPRSLSDALIGQLRDAESSLKTVAAIEKEWESLRKSGDIGLLSGSINRPGSEAARAHARIEQLTGQLASQMRNAVETGVMNDKDYERYMKLMPDPASISSENQWKNFLTLKKRMEGDLTSFMQKLESVGYNLGDFGGMSRQTMIEELIGR